MKQFFFIIFSQMCVRKEKHSHLRSCLICLLEYYRYINYFLLGTLKYYNSALDSVKTKSDPIRIFVA